MKLKALVAVCALAFAGQAAALSPSTTPDVTIFLSGSSAAQTMIGQVAKSMMDPTTLDVYWDGSATVPSGKNYRAYFGRASAAAIAAYPSLDAGGGVGKKILLLETALGGSIQGVNPVSTSSTVGSINMSSCALSAPAVGDTATGVANMYTCTGVQNRVPDFGISDVEPADLEAQINLPAGGTALSPAQLSALVQKGVFAQVMGVPVTSNVPATLKSLSKAQVAGLMGGNVYDWSLIEPTATGKSVIVCRRGAGSGTQATINASFFGAPCMTGSLLPLTYSATSATLGSSTAVAAGNTVVVENSSSGAVKTCLQYAKDGTPSGSAIRVTDGSIVAAGSANSVVLPAGGYGIGVLGLDQGTTAHYVFADINGTVASVENATSGKYDILVESTIQNRGDLTGLKADVAALFANNAGDPSIIGTGGVAGVPMPGIAGLSEMGWTAPATFDQHYPVLRAGNSGNTCTPMATFQ